MKLDLYPTPIVMPTPQVNFPEAQVRIGIYYENTDTTKKVRQGLYSFALDSANLITPTLPPGCTVGANTCIYEGIYIDTVSLPVLDFNGETAQGYHLYYDRCCRNGNITNLLNPGNASMVFYAFIPPLSFENSSPIFQEKPLPFICTEDSLQIFNNAIDQDNDSLVFSFQDPINGYGSVFNPAIIPADTLDWPLPLVNWLDNSFSTTDPFGNSGFSEIDEQTGLSNYYINAAGNYVTAVEVKEYRQDSLIGVSRLDIQLLALVCPINPFPSLSTTSSNFIDTTIMAGDTLCFDVSFSDSNFDGTPQDDSVEVQLLGNIFTVPLNPPTHNGPTFDQGMASVQFCWETSCLEASQTDYIFIAEAQDNGCPNKTQTQQFNVNVYLPLIDSINGINTICSIDSVYQYNIEQEDGLSYTWGVTGGQVIADSNHYILVDWDNSAVQHEIYCIATNTFGCSGDTVHKSINLGLINDIVIDSILSICPNSTLTVPLDSNYSYSFSPLTGIHTANDTLHIQNTGSILTYQVQINYTGCAYTDSFEIVSLSPQPALVSANAVTYCDSSIISLEVESTGISQTYWYSNNQLMDTLSNISFTTAQSTPTTVTLIYEDTAGCQDTLLVSLSNVPSTNISIDSLSNVMSPNNDGINDVFKISPNFQFHDCARLQVFNRWGSLLFDSEGGFLVWNGRSFDGQLVKRGVYYYTLSVDNKVYASSYIHVNY